MEYPPEFYRFRKFLTFSGVSLDDLRSLLERVGAPLVANNDASALLLDFIKQTSFNRKNAEEPDKLEREFVSHLGKLKALTDRLRARTEEKLIALERLKRDGLILVSLEEDWSRHLVELVALQSQLAIEQRFFFVRKRGQHGASWSRRNLPSLASLLEAAWREAGHARVKVKVRHLALQAICKEMDGLETDIDTIRKALPGRTNKGKNGTKK